jgi:hypothetical protein
MRRTLLQVGVLALAVAGATWWIGWWTVPLVAAAWGAAARGEGYPVITSAVGAALGWVLLLALEATAGPVGELSRKLGGIMGVPGWVPLALTVALPAALAAGAAGLVGALQRRPT